MSSSSSMPQSHLYYFTKSFTSRFHQSRHHFKQRHSELSERQISRQTSSQFRRRQLSGFKDQEYQNLLRDIEENRIVRLRSQQLAAQRKNQEYKLLHQTSQEKIRMLKETKNKTETWQQKQWREQEEEARRQNMFRRRLSQQQYSRKQAILQGKMEFLLNCETELASSRRKSNRVSNECLPKIAL